MSHQNHILNSANKLEGLLRKYLNCGYNDFGVKANDNLTMHDWKSPINFALGHLHGKSNNVNDLIENYEYYNFDSTDKAHDYVDKTIEKLEKLLFQDVSN